MSIFTYLNFFCKYPLCKAVYDFGTPGILGILALTLCFSISVGVVQVLWFFLFDPASVGLKMFYIFIGYFVLYLLLISLLVGSAVIDLIYSYLHPTNNAPFYPIIIEHLLLSTL